MWGWTELGLKATPLALIFPTYVGVNRNKARRSPRRSHFPHVCGGEPKKQIRLKKNWKFSPRMWGWTVWPALLLSWLPFSPRMWGWTGTADIIPSVEEIFPTYVGVNRKKASLVSTGVVHADRITLSYNEAFSNLSLIEDNKNFDGLNNRTQLFKSKLLNMTAFLFGNEGWAFPVVT